MSDTESIYTRTEYQATEYWDSDSGENDAEPGDVPDTDGECHADRVDPPHASDGISDQQLNHCGTLGDAEANAKQPRPELSQDAGDGDTSGDVVEDTGEEGAENKPTAFPPEVLEILRDNWGEWKAAGRKDRKGIWKAICDQLKELDMHKDVDSVEWCARLRLYNHWMRRRAKGKENRKAIRLGQKWTARSVVRETHKDKIREILAEQFGKPRHAANIECWQPALTLLMNNLSEEELEAAQATATEWNSRGASTDAKYRFATRGAYKVMKSFAEEMWKRGGLRLLILSGFKNDKGALFSQIYDFNKNIADGPAFDADDANSFPDEKSDAEEGGDGEGQPKAIRKSRAVTNKDALIAKITMEDGTIWIPDISDATRAEKQALVRAFLTSHYRDACQNNKVSAPFKQLAKFQNQLFKDYHLPPDFVFPDDPSHMTTKETSRFLNFIRNRQDTHPGDVFAFQHWLKDKALMPIVNPGEAGEEVGEEVGEEGGENSTDAAMSDPPGVVAGDPAICTAGVTDPAVNHSNKANGSQSGPGKSACIMNPTHSVDTPKQVGISLPSASADCGVDNVKRQLHGDDSTVQKLPENITKLKKHATAKKSTSKGKHKAECISSKGMPSPNQPSSKHHDTAMTKIFPPIQDAQTIANEMNAKSAVTLSFRPPSKSIVQQEKERLNITSGSTKQSLDLSSKGIKQSSGVSNQQQTPGPSKEIRENVIRRGAPELFRQPDGHTEVPGESDQGVYKEIPVVPLHKSDSPMRLAQPNHHKMGPPLKSAMKVASSNHITAAGSPAAVNANAAEKDIHRPVNADQGGQSATTAEKTGVRRMPVMPNTADKHGPEIDRALGNSAKGPEHTPINPPKPIASAEAKQNDSMNVGTVPEKRARKNRADITKQDGSKKGKGEQKVTRIPTAIYNSDEDSAIPSTPSKKADVEEPVTPPMKPAINAKRTASGSANTNPRPPGVAPGENGSETQRMAETVMKADVVSIVPETPRRSGRARRPPPPPDIDFEDMQPKSKKIRRVG